MMLRHLVRTRGIPNFGGEIIRGKLKKPLLRTLSASVNAAQISKIEAYRKLEDGSAVEVTWSDGECSRYHSSWLRFNCRCATCMQGYHAQINWDWEDLPNPLTLSDVKEFDNKLQFVWANEDGHVGELSLEWLKRNSYSEQARKQRSKAQTSQVHVGQNAVPEVQYGDVMNSQEGLWQFVHQISEHGVSLMKNVPPDMEHTYKVTEKLGPVMGTVYGPDFESVIVSSGDYSQVNIAMSEAPLHLHMDLPYYSLPPGLQILHCLRFDPQVEGGESTLLDGFHVAEEMRRLHPEDFETLVRVPTTFVRNYAPDGEIPVSMSQKRTHISLTPDGEVAGFCWAPSYSGLLSVPEEDVEPYFKAYRRLAYMINHSPMQKAIKLQTGDLLCFNNLRLLHGRTGFKSNGGVRHLKGTYVNIDDFKNTYSVLSKVFDDGRPCKRLGNPCLH